jgi:hypothetical protein
MEDTSAIWPFSVEAASLEESVSFFEKEVIGNKLVLISFWHTLERIIFTLEVTIQTDKDL